jgi:hypothetical protein
MKGFVYLAAIAAFGLGACGDDGGGDSADAAGGGIDSAPAIDAAPQCPVTTVLYLNGDGGTFAPGLNDSVAGTAQYFNAETTLDPFPLDADAFDFVVDCMVDALAPFNVELVTSDPGDVDHQELVYTGSSPESLGFQAGIGSLASGNCTVNPRDVALVFRAGMLVTDCRSALWTFGVHMGLSPTTECSDAMTWVAACDNLMPTYVDEEFDCGTDMPQMCNCSGEDTQNSHQHLISTVGPDTCLP